LTGQNNVLHRHLDNVSSQAARIRQAADMTVTMPGEDDTADGTEARLSELRCGPLPEKGEGDYGHVARAWEAEGRTSKDANRTRLV